jgi:hypothetical protein
MSSKPKSKSTRTKYLFYDSNDTAHLETWRTNTRIEIGKQFGNIAYIFDTDTYPTPTTSMDSVEHLKSKTDMTDYEKIYVGKVMDAHVKQNQHLEQAKPKAFNLMLSLISRSSTTIIQKYVVTHNSTDLLPKNPNDTVKENDGIIMNLQGILDEEEYQSEHSISQPRAPRKPSTKPFFQPTPADDESQTQSTHTNFDYESFSSWKRFISRRDPLELWLVINTTHTSARNHIERLDDLPLSLYSLKQYETDCSAHTNNDLILLNKTICARNYPHLIMNLSLHTSLCHSTAYMTD